jgi:glycosyltransferase involved in cell wall biosynthesis
MSEAIVARLLARSHFIVLTPNSLTRHWLENRGISPEAVTLTRNGPSLQRTATTDEVLFSLEPALSLLDGRRFVLFFARLTSLKGARDLPAISRYVLENSRDTRVVICGGEGPEAELVHRTLEAQETNGSVAFLGFVTEAIKTWLFLRAHVLIAPSYEEGWGLTVKDAVASGCWVVAYDLPAIRESCADGPVFVPLGNVTAFSHATALCLERPRPAPALDSSIVLWTQIARDDLEAVLAQNRRRGPE